MMRARHYLSGQEHYNTLVQPADEFLVAFPTSSKGKRIIAYLHARRAIALSSHGNDMGEESGRKWHAKALQAARLAKDLYPVSSRAMSFLCRIFLRICRVPCQGALPGMIESKGSLLSLFPLRLV